MHVEEQHLTSSEESSGTRIPREAWKPERLFDYLLAGEAHQALLKFLGLERAQYQPSEIHVERQVPDRVFWEEALLHVLDLKVEINSRELAKLIVKRSVARLHYVDHGPFLSGFKTKYDVALQNVILHVFCILRPSEDFRRLLRKLNVKWYSLEEGKRSAIPLDYSRDPLPLVIADLRNRLQTASTESERKILREDLESLTRRHFSSPEKLFLHRYQQLMTFSFVKEDEMMSELLKQLEEVVRLTETDLRQILKENLYLLSPEERLAGLKPEERLAGLKPEELEVLAREVQRRLQETAKRRDQSSS